MTIHSKDLVKSREVPSSQPSTRPWLNKSLVAVKEQVEQKLLPEVPSLEPSPPP